MKRPPLVLFLVAACLWVTLLQCTPIPHPIKATGTAPPGTQTVSLTGLTPARQYAGEVLAYMMRVVLGDAGAPELRGTWRNRGLDVRLDLDNINAIMNGNGRAKSDLMVFDPNILGLSEVLYHYDKTLNQFKGRRIFDSIYPSPELIALRLLLVQKRHRGEKIRMKPLFDRGSVLLDASIEATDADLRATNLNAVEMRLLEDVLEKDPTFFFYLRHPFLLSALYEADLIEFDAVVRSALGKANYKNRSCRALNELRSSPAVKIVLLPSLIANFEFGPGVTNLNPSGFHSTASYQKAMMRLEKDILSATERRVKEDIARKKGRAWSAGSQGWEAWWRNLVRKEILFIHQDQRPLVVLPGNAGDTVNDICPGADFFMIILGKNVYRSIRFDEKHDMYPAVNRIYLDFLDVKFTQASDEIDRVSRFVFLKLSRSNRLAF